MSIKTFKIDLNYFDKFFNFNLKSMEFDYESVSNPQEMVHRIRRIKKDIEKKLSLYYCLLSNRKNFNKKFNNKIEKKKEKEEKYRKNDFVEIRKNKIIGDGLVKPLTATYSIIANYNSTCEVRSLVAKQAEFAVNIIKEKNEEYFRKRKEIIYYMLDENNSSHIEKIESLSKEAKDLGGDLYKAVCALLYYERIIRDLVSEDLHDFLAQLYFRLVDPEDFKKELEEEKNKRYEAYYAQLRERYKEEIKKENYKKEKSEIEELVEKAECMKRELEADIVNRNFQKKLNEQPELVNEIINKMQNQVAKEKEEMNINNKKKNEKCIIF